jgi:hypothetical protein
MTSETVLLACDRCSRVKGPYDDLAERAAALLAHEWIVVEGRAVCDLCNGATPRNRPRHRAPD